MVIGNSTYRKEMVMEKDVYQRLREWLDTHPVGAPESENILEILRIMFSPEEAELNMLLPLTPTPIAEIAKNIEMEEKELKQYLGRLISKDCKVLPYPGKVREVVTRVFEDPENPKNILLFHNGESTPMDHYGPSRSASHYGRRHILTRRPQENDP